MIVHTGTGNWGQHKCRRWGKKGRRGLQPADFLTTYMAFCSEQAEVSLLRYQLCLRTDPITTRCFHSLTKQEGATTRVAEVSALATKPAQNWPTKLPSRHNYHRLDSLCGATWAPGIMLTSLPKQNQRLD